MGKSKVLRKVSPPRPVPLYGTDQDLIGASLWSNYRHFGKVFAPHLLLLVRVLVRKKVFGRQGSGYQVCLLLSWSHGNDKVFSAT